MAVQKQTLRAEGNLEIQDGYVLLPRGDDHKLLEFTDRLKIAPAFGWQFPTVEADGVYIDENGQLMMSIACGPALRQNCKRRPDLY
jgi:hypothetical protein